MEVLGYLMLTVFAVLIFVTVIGKFLAPKPPAGEDDAEGARRAEPTPTDVDRFLAEVNRRRREAERQQSQPQQSQPLPRPEARREPRREQDQEQARERDRRSERAAAATRRVSDGQARRLPVVQLAEVVEVVAETPMPKSTTPRLATRPPSPVLAEVRQLLRSPRSAGAAIVLQEILGPPLSRRRGHAPGVDRPTPE